MSPSTERHRDRIVCERRAAVNAGVAAIGFSLMLLGCGAERAPSLSWHRALNAVEEGRFDLARGYLETVYAERPRDLEVCTLRARSWSRGRMQSPARAIAAWQSCGEIAQSDEGRLEIARAHVRLGAFEEAMQALEGIAPSAESHGLRAEALLRLDPARAMSDLAVAVEQFPDDAKLRKLASRAAHLAGNPELALEQANEAVDLDPVDARMIYLQGRLLQSQGLPGEAAEAFERHELVSLLRGLGGRVEPTAVEKLRLLAELGARTPAVEVWKIELLSAVGRVDDAVEAIERLAGAQGPPELLRAESVAVRLGRPALARDLLKRAEEAATEPALIREVRYRQARLLYMEEDGDGAAREIESALASDPWVARFVDLRARLEESAGDTAAAAKSFARALELAPWNVETRLALAGLELGRGERERAERLLSAAPEPSPAIEDFRRRHGLV